MKVLMMFFSLLISSQALAMDEVTAFSYRDDFQVEKVVLNQEILLNDLTKLHPDLDIETKRMMAGEFEKKTVSKDSLRF